MSENVYSFDDNGRIPCQIQNDDEFLMSVDKCTLFKWQQYDAWRNPCYGGYVQVYDRMEDNCINGGMVETLPQDIISEIKEQIRHSEVLDITTMESPLVLDGFIDLFHFSDGEKSNDIESGNIRCFASDRS